MFIIDGMHVAKGVGNNFYGLLKMKSCVNAEQNESITMRKNENGSICNQCGKVVLVINQ